MPFKDTERGKAYQKAYLLEYGRKNREKLNGNARAWRERNLSKSRLIARTSKLKIKYGITLEEYTSLYELQKGCCAVCLMHQSKRNRTLHVDHDHVAGKIRGLLCDNCNLALGLLKDSEDTLLRLVGYLRNNG